MSSIQAMACDITPPLSQGPRRSLSVWFVVFQRAVRFHDQSVFRFVRIEGFCVLHKLHWLPGRLLIPYPFDEGFSHATPASAFPSSAEYLLYFPFIFAVFSPNGRWLAVVYFLAWQGVGSSSSQEVNVKSRMDRRWHVEFYYVAIHYLSDGVFVV